MPPESALLLVLDALLRERWTACDAPLNKTELLSSPSPAVAFQSPAVRVVVRALRVNRTLFVHFVSDACATRLDLQVREYVKLAQSSLPAADERDRVVRVGEWSCSKELLRWRLERSVFAEFAPTAASSMQAELEKLAEPVLAGLLGFLRGPEFVRATQANKHLHRLDGNRALWQQILQQEYPGTRTSTTAGDERPEKSAYVAQHRLKLQRRCDRLRPLDAFLPSPLHPFGLWVPPAPFLPVFPGGERRGRDPSWDLDFDSDLRLPFDRR